MGKSKHIYFLRQDSQIQSKQTNIGPRKGKYIGCMLQPLPTPIADNTCHSQHCHAELRCNLRKSNTAVHAAGDTTGT